MSQTAQSDPVIHAFAGMTSVADDSF